MTTLPGLAPTFAFTFRLTRVVADVDDTTPNEPGHPSLVLILECGDDLARIVIPASVWPLEKRELLAVDRPIAVSGETDGAPFDMAHWLSRLGYGCSTAITN